MKCKALPINYCFNVINNNLATEVLKIFIVIFKTYFSKCFLDIICISNYFWFRQFKVQEEVPSPYSRDYKVLVGIKCFFFCSVKKLYSIQIFLAI